MAVLPADGHPPGQNGGQNGNGNGRRNGGLRLDLQLIAEMVASGARVLDVGCGDGELLSHLARTKGVDGRGIELSQERVNACVARGLAVVQGDADADLSYYPDASFDYVVLSRTLQAVYEPRRVLEQLLRVGRRAIVSFPNFGHWRVRLQLLTRGRMPETDLLPDPWWASKNLHLCTIVDFMDLCRTMGVHVERTVVLDDEGRRLPITVPGWRANLFGEQAICLLSGGGRPAGE